MTLLTTLEVLNYGLVLIYGLFLSAEIAGGWNTKRQKAPILVLCPLLLLVQGLCWILLGEETVRKLYPLIVHLPLTLALIFGLKKQVGVALVSVCTAYLLCQLPRWARLSITALTASPLAGEIGYTLLILPLFFLLQRFFVRTTYDAMTYSSQSLLLFGSLPLAYYLFDYATAVYSNALHMENQVLSEFLPTALIIFYLVFLSAHHAHTQRLTHVELQKTMLEAELKQSSSEIESLRRAETQTAIYQHDMRHHLTMIENFLSVGKSRQAEEYIKKVQADVEAVTPKRFCENEIVNLLCSSFSSKAARLGVRLTVDASLPNALTISDTELCSVVSNGLENALHAVKNLEETCKWVEFYGEVRLNKLLIEIKNPYGDKVVMRDGLPVSNRDGHGYGCHSIRTIAEHNRGLCSFEPENGIFTLRLVLPTQNKSM